VALLIRQDTPLLAAGRFIRFFSLFSAHTGAQKVLSRRVTTQRESGSGGKKMVIPQKVGKWPALETYGPNMQGLSKGHDSRIRLSARAPSSSFGGESVRIFRNTLAL